MAAGGTSNSLSLLRHWARSPPACPLLLGVFPNPPPSPPPWLPAGEKSPHLRFPRFCQQEPLEAGFGVLLMCPSFFKPVLTLWYGKSSRPGCTCSALVLGSVISPKQRLLWAKAVLKPELRVLCTHGYGGVPALQPSRSQERSSSRSHLDSFINTSF